MLVMRSMARSLSLFALALLSCFVTGSGCSERRDGPSETAAGGFGIFLLAEDRLLDESVELSEIELSGEPLMSTADIASYAAGTHEIELVPSAAERLAELDLPGRFFVVTVDRDPVYFGAFMALYFSRTYAGPVILWPPMDEGGRKIRIQLGYPGPDFFAGEDPRAESRIVASLKEAGKLR